MDETLFWLSFRKFQTTGAVIELLCGYWTNKNKKLTNRKTQLINNDADDDDATEQCQEEESGSAFDIHSGNAAMENHLVQFLY